VAEIPQTTGIGGCSPCPIAHPAFAYSSSDLQKVQGYVVSANFPMVDGLKEGGDVKVNGVKVGSIAGLGLITDPGPNQYLVNVRMSIKPDVRLPADTIALAATESLLGGKYLSLEVGVEDEMIKTDGTGRLTRTQAPMRLDDLIGQLIYSSKKSDGAGAASPAPAPEPAHP
jgi:phospholipid/cholesterol/gamma-HCH transport system substrate-binding protein